MSISSKSKLDLILESQKYKKELSPDFISQLIKENKPTKKFQLGVSAYFVFYLTAVKMIFVEDTIESIYGISAKEILLQNSMQLTNELIEYAHSNEVTEMIVKSYELCVKYKDHKNMSINFEHNIRTKDHEKKRILCQYSPLAINDAGYPILSHGFITDITHTKKDGLPILYVLANDELVFHEESQSESIVTTKHIPFTKRQVEILKKMSEGFSAKEVASKMNLSVATIYTQTKLVKNRTGKDVKSAIKYLELRGLL